MKMKPTTNTRATLLRPIGMVTLCLGMVALPALLLGCETTRSSGYGRSGGSSTSGETSSTVRTGAGPDARAATVTVPAMPTSVEQFQAWRDEVATTPEGGAATWIVALHLYTQDEDLGNACLTMQCEREQLIEAANEDEGHYRGFRIHSSSRYALETTLRPSRQPFVPASYFEGTSPENGYALPAPPLTLKFHVRDVDENTARVFIFSSGADHDRPMTLKKNNRGIWKAHEWSSIVTGIRAPAAEEVDDDF